MSAVTYEAIVEAFEALKTSGIEQPTRKDVRDYLGKGSMTTINKYLKLYIDSQQASVPYGRAPSSRSALKAAGTGELDGFVSLILSMEKRIADLEAALHDLTSDTKPDMSSNAHQVGKSPESKPQAHKSKLLT